MVFRTNGAGMAGRVIRESAGNLAGVRVLITDDNLVNRTLASALVVRRGALVTVAVNGLEAVAACRATAFDIVLMDIQMPELDGLGATRRIRGLEAIAGAGWRTPIIALTAHAMAGDRNRFLEAGMDGYVSKPIRAIELFTEIVRLLPIQQVPFMSLDVENTATFDLAGLRETADADDALVTEVIRLFVADAPTLLASIDRAVGADDRTALREAAHALKGSAASLTAAAVAAAAGALETLALSGTALAAAPALAAKLRDDMATLHKALRAVLVGALAA